MTSATESFFSKLNDEQQVHVLDKARGVVRFELARGDEVESWTVRVDRGVVEVEGTAGGEEPSCVVQCTQDQFEEIASGRANAMATVLRGDMAIRGDTRLLLLFQRVFPRPPGARHPRTVVDSGRGSS